MVRKEGRLQTCTMDEGKGEKEKRKKEKKKKKRPAINHLVGNSYHVTK